MEAVSEKPADNSVNSSLDNITAATTPSEQREQQKQREQQEQQEQQEQSEQPPGTSTKRKPALAFPTGYLNALRNHVRGKATNGKRRDKSAAQENAPVNEKVVVEERRPDEENEATRTEERAGTNEENEDEVEVQYLTGIVLLFLVVALCLVTFMVGLDQMIIATAIPKITTQFHSLEDVGWYGSAYLLTTTSLQPTYGKIYSFFNVKFSFVFAMFVFELGSVICAVAPNSNALIVGRAIAGVGAAGLYSGGMTIIGYSVPLRRRAIYLASLASMFGIASIVGPVLGGAFTDKLTWRWCFWINLPFGGLAIATVVFFFKNPTRRNSDKTLKQKMKEMDLLGAFFLISAIVCLLLALQWGGITYPWHDSKVFGCLIGFGLLIIVFIVLQLRAGEHATIPPRIIGQRTVTASALTLVFLAMGIYTHVYYLPFYFQAVKGVDAEQSGIRCVAYLVSNTIAAVINGAGVTVVGYYAPFVWVGTAVFAVGAGLLHMLKVNSPHNIWIGYQIVAGVGSGAAIQLPFIAVQVVLKPKDMPTGNAIAIFFNSLGGAIAISIAENIFTNTLIKKLELYVPSVNPEVVINAGATHLTDVVTPAQLPGTILSYDIAVTTAFILPIATACLAFFSSLLFEWKSVKGANLMGAGGGG